MSSFGMSPNLNADSSYIYKPLTSNQKSIYSIIFSLFILLIAFLIYYFTSKELFNGGKEMENVMQIDPIDMKNEPFNNDLSDTKLPIFDPNGMSEIGTDYSDIIATQALEKGVFEQHKAYINEKNNVTNTASRNPTRSDSQDLIPFVGLRRPQYQVDGKDMVDPTARQVHSVVNADQLGKPDNLSW
jgi:hypothetical protein